MKRKTIFLLFAYFFICVNLVFAFPISKKQAFLVAKNKLIYLNKTDFSVKNIEKKSANSQIIYYIAHLKPMGFIVVSADTELFPIYSYSFTNNFFRKNKKEFNPLDNLLTKNITYILANKEQKSSKINKAIKKEWDYYLSENFNKNRNKDLIQWPPSGTTSTEGWLETNWHQNDPYNQFCPLDKDVKDSRSVAGCPAIALSMIINYYQKLNSTTFTDADDYVHNYSGNNFTIDDDFMSYDFLSFTQINYYLSDIATKYDNQQTITNQEAAALSFACGVAATQVYSASVSGTFGVDQAFDAYQKFGFSNAELIDENTPDFYEIFRQNMIDGKPAHLALTDPPPVSVGHNVVADGYNTDNYYHINFGWGGSYNNWYLVPQGMPYNLTEIEGVVVNICNPPINNEAEFYHFELNQQTTQATIGTNTIDIEVQYGTDLTSLVPVFQISRGATAYVDGSEIISGETVVDFSDCPLTITVIAENGTDTKNWHVNVTVAENTATDFLTFELDEQTSPANIENGTIDIQVEAGTDLSTLVPIFTLSQGATAEVDGNILISGVTVVDFSEGSKNILVTAQDETTTQNWNVTVILETDIQELNTKFKIYPNPTNGILNIEANNIEKIIIYNTAAKKIDTYIKTENNFSIDLKNKANSNGVFYLKLKDKTGNCFYKKIILQ